MKQQYLQALTAECVIPLARVYKQQGQQKLEEVWDMIL